MFFPFQPRDLSSAKPGESAQRHQQQLVSIRRRQQRRYFLRCEDLNLTRLDLDARGGIGRGVAVARQITAALRKRERRYQRDPDIVTRARAERSGSKIIINLGSREFGLPCFE